MSKFTETINQHCEGIANINPGASAICPDCLCIYGVEDTDDIDDMQEQLYCLEEPAFSWRDCDTCGTSLGGDRQEAHGFDADNNVVHLDICCDCAAWFANGNEPENWEG